MSRGHVNNLKKTKCYDQVPEHPWTAQVPHVVKGQRAPQWAERRFKFALSSSEEAHYWDDQDIFNKVAFIDPVPMVLGRTEDKAIMQNESTLPTWWMSEDARWERFNMRGDPRYKKQKATGDKKPFFLFLLWRVRFFKHIYFKIILKYYKNYD